MVWYEFSLHVNVKTDLFSIALNAKSLLEKAELLDPVSSLERISFRTGPCRIEPLLRTPKSPGEDLPNADDAVPLATY